MFRKQLLYLSHDHLTAYQWARGTLSAGQDHANDEAGQAALSNALGGARAAPIYLLVDLIEEDFQRESLPHVLGRTRNAMVQRRLTQLYRDTPYRQAIQQGREAFGRRDDRLLFSALTNADLLKPWVDAILQKKAPLAGIYSPALLSPLLVKKLGLAYDSARPSGLSGSESRGARDHLLLITRHSGGLRQSYFQGHNLKFSRLTPLLDHSTAAVADSVVRETEKTQQFLTSTRLLPRGETLAVVIIDNGKNLPALAAACGDRANLAHRFLDLAEAADTLGLRQIAPDALCDVLFLHLLASRAPASHYALPEQTRYFTLWQVRAALYILSAGAAAGALLSAGANSLDAVSMVMQSRHLDAEAQSESARYEALLRSIPPTVASPHNMKAAVVLEQMIANQAPPPAELLTVVSRALDRLPQIQLQQLQWHVSQTPDSTATEGAETLPAVAPAAIAAPAGNAEPAPPAALLGIPGRPYQILRLEGEVSPFQQDYRSALESVRQFAAELARQPGLDVKIIRQPLDTRPTSRLEGRAGSDDKPARADFALQLTRKP